MNKNVAGTGWFMLKGICVALTLVLGLSLFAAGAIADSECGKKCCHHGKPMGMHHSRGALKSSPAGFCNGDPIIPCDLESRRASDVPEFILSSAGGDPTNTAPSASIEADSLIDSHRFENSGATHLWGGKYRSAPIYLQNLSFLI
jgi:hypothetical protein